jgi:hypothetical protein
MPDPVRPRCSAVLDARRYSQAAVRSVGFDGTDLLIEIQGQGSSFARLVFRDVIGFRVLDERDLCEFWPEYSEPKGWLWEVHSGGWMDLERHRPLFNSPEFIAAIREYLVVDNKCVSILCTQPPEIVDVGALPEEA